MTGDGYRMGGRSASGSTAPSARAGRVRPAHGLGAVAAGAVAAVALLAIYFAVLVAVSGWVFTGREFAKYWYYVLPLAAGFGIQVGLFVRLRQVVAEARHAGTVVAASGTASTAAMVSCCAHYLASAAPVLGATGLVAFAAQFQVELFWLGLAMNLVGIAFMGSRLAKARRETA